ncbi:MAG TPA: hypothetical protein VMK84_14935, partial [Streptosporangiaceae bacterium]|nr:hypothetical protein [Streptosporangiaceae bacterium]
AGELLAIGGVENRFDQQADVSGIDDGDRVAEADGCLVGEAGPTGAGLCARPNWAARRRAGR